MKFSINKTPSHLQTDLLGVAFDQNGLTTSWARHLDKELGGQLSQVIKREELKGKSGDTRLIDVQGKKGVRAILLIGVGEWKKLNTEIARKLGAKLVKTGNRIKASKISVEDLSVEGSPIQPTELGHALAEGVMLGNYTFDLYKAKNENKKTVEHFEVLSSESDVKKGLEQGYLFAEATNFARDLINIPASDMTPLRMSQEAKKISGSGHLSIQVHNRQAIEKMGMGCYLAVAQGSLHPPYFVHLRYRPSVKPKKTIVIIGKGITFDSGGLSLKTAQSMETMKDDMSGAAAMVAVMKTLPKLGLPIEVHGITALAENMPSGSAVRPGDIARSMNGKTVEILNTDAEGRLTLADAMTYALKQKPDLVIDVATLTGACVVALGDRCSGILGNNQELINKLIDSSTKAGEKIWQLPLIDEYRDELKSSVADLKNIGGRWGGTINGALFIQEFTDSKIPWAHIDIAGPSWTEKELDDCPKGGTGHIVRTLLHFLIKES